MDNLFNAPLVTLPAAVGFARYLVPAGRSIGFRMRAAKPTPLDGGFKLRLAHKASVYDSVQTGRAGIAHNGDAESSISTIIRMCGNLGLSHY